ncbi:hypothetical protein J7K44_02090 [bacterium]|nr:hypothetical protein [bacterium]
MMNNKFNITIICFIVILILGVWVLFPESQRLIELQKSIKANQAKLQSEEESINRFYQLSEKLDSEKYKESLKKIDYALPSTIFPPSLFNFLQKKARDKGLSLDGIGTIVTGSLGKNTKIKTHSFNLSLSGRYSALKSFLTFLEKNARLFEVESISFSSPSLREEPIFSFSIRMRVHSY